MKILAVDDDEIILELLQASMELEGFTNVTTATSAKEALKIIGHSARPFDCFLLDIQMPDMDGIELCKAIRSQKPYKKTPILMITAMSDKSYVDRAFSAGATDYVSKPFDVLELNTRVNLAQKLVSETHANIESAHAVETLRAEIQNSNKHSLDDPVSIENVDGVIDYLAFENYLLQLARGNLFSSSVFAIKIANIRNIYARCAPSEFVFTLTDIGESISLNTKHLESLLAYRGNGIFVCVCHQGKFLDPEELKISVRDTLNEMDLVYDNGTHMKIDMVFGQLKTPGVFAKAGSLSLLNKAVEDVESRVAQVKASQPSVSQHRLPARNAKKPLAKSLAMLLK